LSGLGPFFKPTSDQRWQHWQVRLFKATSSLRLFDFGVEFGSLKTYAHRLMQRGESITFVRHDLIWLFTTGGDPEKSR